MTIQDPTAPMTTSTDPMKTATTHGVDAGKEVAAEVAHQAAGVATEAKAQITNVVDRARHEFAAEATTQADRGLHGLRTLSDQVAALADGRPQEAGHLGEIVADAGHRLQQYMTSLEQRGSRGLIDDVQRFARRRPGMFLAAAMVAGFATGRLVRGGAAAAKAETDPPANRGALLGGDPTRSMPIGVPV